MTRTLVIGLDGATLNLIEPWAEAGYLPMLSKLMQEGSYGKLRSVLPVLSSAAWASFMTGMNPGKHGFYDFVRREPGGYRLRLLKRDQMAGESLWHILGRHDHPVIVMNVPMTYPPEAVHGLMVSGLGTPDYKPFTHPTTLGAELLKRKYTVNKKTVYHPGAEDAFLKETDDVADRQTETALWLMGTSPWDFFMSVYRDTDEMVHFFWRYMDAAHPAHDPAKSPPYAEAILKFYQKMDDAIGQLVKAAGPDTNVIILSDHGGGPLYKDVFLNEWLRQEGYLVTQNNQIELTGAAGKLARIGLTRSRISSTLRRWHLGRVEQWIKGLLGSRIYSLPRTERAEFPEAIDWTKTRAYSFGYHGQIYVNLQGREAQGIVPPGEAYGQLCQEITDRLMRLTDPQDGKPVVDQVWRQEEIFAGPYLDYAPDLTLVMRDHAYITRQGYEFGTQGGQIFADPLTHESGSHRLEGTLIAWGPDIAPAGSQEGARLIDVAPTILHLMGCPIPTDMDGAVLQNWVKLNSAPRFEQKDPTGIVPSGPSSPLSEEDEQEVIERLKNLGYLE